MSQVTSIEEALEKKTQEKHLSDYRASHFAVSTLDLEFDLYDENTQVKATSVMNRIGDNNQPLFLFGEQLKLLSVMVDDIEYAPLTDAPPQRDITLQRFAPLENIP